LESHTTSLIEALDLGKKEHIAFVGGGGKTSLMFALAEELLCCNNTVLTSTTTKVAHREAKLAPLVVLLEGSEKMKELREKLKSERHLFVSERLLDSGKVQGIAPSLADTFYRELPLDYLLVEADGSAGHPIKAPALHEPVIPESVTIVLALLGLEALGRMFSPETVFRPELAAKIMGLKPGEELSASALATLFLNPQGLFKGTPGSAKKMAFLNKVDLLPQESKATDLAGLILADAKNGVDRAIIGSLKERSYWVRRNSHGRHLS
jgi:probable selenium-dependent hydroxylase accessory protein YqeC